MGRACSVNGEKRNAYRILVGNPEGKRPLGRPRRRWVNNIKKDLRQTGWNGMDWTDLVQDRDSCEHGNESACSRNAGKLLSACTIGDFSRRARLHE
jgi:hypothetical protein